MTEDERDELNAAKAEIETLREKLRFATHRYVKLSDQIYGPGGIISGLFAAINDMTKSASAKLLGANDANE